MRAYVRVQSCLCMCACILHVCRTVNIQFRSTTLVNNYNTIMPVKKALHQNIAMACLIIIVKLHRKCFVDLPNEKE